MKLIRNGKEVSKIINNSYSVELNPSARGEADRFLVQSCRLSDNGGSFSLCTLYVGSNEKCSLYAKKLISGTIHPEDFVFIRAACATPCHVETSQHRLEALTALVTEENKVYLGSRSQYDGCGHYFNGNDSLIFISDNYDAFDVLIDGWRLFSQIRQTETRCFTQKELANIRTIGLLIELQS